jgi:ABC-type Na+ efflux pump permease subunit
VHKQVSALERQLEETEALLTFERAAAATEAASRQSRLEALAGAVVSAEQRFKDELAAATSAHANDVQEAEARGKAAGSAEVSAAFEAAKQEHAEAMSRLQAESSASQQSWKAKREALEEQVSQREESLKEVRRDAEFLRAEIQRQVAEIDTLHAKVREKAYVITRNTFFVSFFVFFARPFLVFSFYFYYSSSICLIYSKCVSGSVTKSGL